jgi:hypothetical protein
MEAHRVLTVSEAADYCAIPEYAVQAWINRKQLVVCWLPTGNQRFRLIDVIAALEASKKREVTKSTDI